MVQIEQVDTHNKRQVHQFVQFHYDLYKKCPYWVPPFYSDIEMMLNKEKHPFYEHSEADFFVAKRGDEVVGRVAVMVNKHYNEYHNSHQGLFYLFDSIDDQEVVNKLFERGFAWHKQRGVTKVVGPEGFTAFDGYGVLVEGYERRQMMTMMNYNYEYYPRLLEAVGFEKEVDFNSTYIDPDTYNLPEKVREIARRIEAKGNFKVKRFKNKKELKEWAWRIGQAYNKTFVNNWEYYPLTDAEVKFMLDNLMVVAVPDLIKIITYDDEVVGFLFGFPDISAALQRHGGKVSMWTPWALIDIFSELKKTKWISLNGVGVLPEYHGRGGNALLYSEFEKTIKEYGYDNAELTQVAETATQMRKDLQNLGAVPVKNHRVYRKFI